MVRAKAPSPLRSAGAVHRACGFARACFGVRWQAKRDTALGRAMGVGGSQVRGACESAVVAALASTVQKFNYLGDDPRVPYLEISHSVAAISPNDRQRSL